MIKDCEPRGARQDRHPRRRRTDDPEVHRRRVNAVGSVALALSAERERAAHTDAVGVGDP
jgi:hypothetical protein